MVGDTLLLARNSQQIRWLSLSNLDSKPEVLAGSVNPGFFGSSGLPESDIEDQAWLPGGSYEEQVWQLWDFAREPQVIQQINAVPHNFGPPLMHPTIVGSPAGGIFE